MNRFDIGYFLFCLFVLCPLYGWAFQCDFRDIFVQTFIVGTIFLFNKYSNRVAR